ncbi:MAG: glycosyltransferase family 9 protein [Pseudomonadota bacterium]
MSAEAGRSFPPDSSFLVIRSANIGDLVCTTPLIRALRQRFPHARICALVNSYNAAVLENNPDLDRVYAYTKLKHRIDGAGVWRTLWNRMALMANLRRQKFDYAIVAGARFLPRGLRMARAIRPRHIVGFTEPGRGSRVIDMAVPYEMPRPLHEVEDVFRLLEPLGIRGEPPPMRVFPNGEEVQRIRSRLGAQPGFPRKILIGIHISSRRPSNRWSLDRFIRLIRELHAKHDAAFMLFWSPGAEDHPHHPGGDAMAARIVTETQGIPLLPCATNRLEELIAGLSCCDAVVCSDGGALHVAAALARPILCFFGDTEAVRWRPWKVPHVLLQSASLRAADIGVEEAVSGFEQLLGQCHAAGVNLTPGGAASSA